MTKLDSRGLHWFVALGFGVFAILGGLLTIQEPLWIDELHTAWTCTAEMSEVAVRARFGNQSPLWFWCESFVWQLSAAEQAEPIYKHVVLRLLSLLCWGATFAIVGWLVYAKEKNLFVIGSLGFLLYCDQINWFYANEARPYAAVCLFVTIAAACQFRLFRSSSQAQRLLHLTAATLAIYLHYTAVMIIASLLTVDFATCLLTGKTCSDGTAGPLQRDHAFVRCKRLLWDALIVFLLVSPALLELLRIGQGRELWQSFGSSADFWRIRSLLPLDAWFVVGLAGLSVFAFYRKHRMDHASIRIACAFAIAVGVCIAGVWLMAWLKVAPLVHTRYVIGGYPLIVLAVGFLLNEFRNRTLVFVSVTAMSVLWMLTQGGPTSFRYHQPIAWQRYEDWPTAVRVVEDYGTQQPNAAIAIAPMLVETRDDQTIENYGAAKLSYAWEAATKLYGRKPQFHVSSPWILVNDSRQWESQVLDWLATDQRGLERVIVVARADGLQVLPWLERLARRLGGDETSVQKLMGAYNSRLSVFSVQVKFGEQEP